MGDRFVSDRLRHHAFAGIAGGAGLGPDRPMVGPGRIVGRPDDLPRQLRITGQFSTGQVAIRVDIVERAGDPPARLQVFSPVGMYLQKPVKLTIDQGQPHSVPYT